MKEKNFKRKRIRLKLYDYSNKGFYFITICSLNRKNLFSKIICRGDHWSPELTPIGKIIEFYINNIERTYKNVMIDEYIIMPNHVHFILHVKNNKYTTISRIINQFKGMVCKNVKMHIWQKSFYEHIIRNEKEYFMIKEYIIDNPKNWNKDKYFN